MIIVGRHIYNKLKELGFSRMNEVQMAQSAFSDKDYPAKKKKKGKRRKKKK